MLFVLQLIGYLAYKLALALSPVNLRLVQNKTCVHVCKLDKKETVAGKLTWVVC